LELKNILCPTCGCLCDDIEVTVDAGRILRVKKACAMGASKFLNYSRERNMVPLIRKDGTLVAAELDEAIDAIAKVLARAEFPVLYGWSLTSCEAIKVGIELAEEIGGVIDNQTTTCHGPGVQANQELGEPTCTLGEVKHRADLVIYWGSNPEEAHPRHLERYSVKAKGRFRTERKERRVVVVDPRKTTSSKFADKVVQVEPGKDFELLTALRMALRFEHIEAERVAGLRLREVEELAEMMRSCEFGVIFYGQGLTQTSGKSKNIEQLIALVRDLNFWTKFNLMPIRGHFNVTGSNEVLTWQTGYPYAVDFSHGYPWYNPGDTSIVDILRRGENDATLVVASDPLANLPRDAAKQLLEVPLMVIDPHMSLTAMAADVVIPCGFAGIEVGGTAYRMDGVALPLRKLADPPPGILSDEEILRRILARVRAAKGPA